MDRAAAYAIVLVLFMACSETTDPNQPPPVPDTIDEVSPDIAGDAPLLPDVPTHVEGLIEGRLCPTDSVANYDNTGGPFLLNWCTGCHSSLLPNGERAGAPLGMDFDTPAGIEEQLLRIYARSADYNTTMPPVNGAPAQERILMGDWITCGAPGLDEAVLRSIALTEPPPTNDPPPGNGGPMTPCTDDSDCEDQCPGSKTGCICAQKTQGDVCARPCTTTADCPKKGNFQCTDGACSKSSGM
jgi:hypothetical protein